jgi:alanyl-tRNA synthetase
MRSGNDIRTEFIEFFRQRNHALVESSSLLPADDPTLLFANAGMNQFKSIFLGTETRDYSRAANSQKCIRAGGKHNDLEDVGRDTYHHTFFEMLGNWSFGDYFKAEAIQWAWELLTDVWGLEPDRLHVTVFEGDPSDALEADTEAERLWRELTSVNPDHIHRGSKKDNFWEMGETGPCGPCSEIHYDRTPDKSGAALVNADDQRVIEVWNLVFMQYNRAGDGKLTPLPATHVDTGMGLERITAILQGKQSNYATDLFVPLIEKLETLCSHRYGAEAGGDDRFDTADMHNMGDVACRVIADHARALTFAIADGVIPSNDGRGYVLRRILRRAARYGRQQLNIHEPFLTGLVDVVVEHFGQAFGELKSRRDYVVRTIRDEEESFGKTLDRGIELFQRQVRKLRDSGRNELDGETVFDLYATYGFPVDLTQRMADEEGLAVDMAGYEQAMEDHRATSSAGGSKFSGMEIPPLPETDDAPKYTGEPVRAKLLGWVSEGKFVQEGRIPPETDVMVVLDRTSFYGESGGQVGDQGRLIGENGAFEVVDTQMAGQSVLHVGRLAEGDISAGQDVRCEVSSRRFDTMRNHTATHLLNWALREVLGDGVNQAGSVVDPERLRFDFTHNQALTPEQQSRIEQLVNQRVLADEQVSAKLIPLAQARKIEGVRAMFGEKYPDPVRVVAVGTDDPQRSSDATVSAEFCGGTHLQHTSQVGLLKILSEESVAKGVRRITAVTGPEALRTVQEADAILRQLGRELRVPPSQIVERIEAMQKQIKELRKKPAGGGGSAEMEVVSELSSPQGQVVIGKVAQADTELMRSLCDQHRQKGAAALLVGGTDGQKVTLTAMVSEELVKAGSFKAGDWVKSAAKVVGGGGGGRPTLAQAGGKQPEKLDDALAEAKRWAEEKL